MKRQGGKQPGHRDCDIDGGKCTENPAPSAAKVRIIPGEHLFQGVLLVRPFREKMPLARIADHFGFPTHEAQSIEERLSLPDRHPRILLPIHDQGRRVAILKEARRGMSVI